VARTRTTKKLAQRIDLNYFKRPTPLKRAKFWLSLLLPWLALLWIADRTIFKDARVYSSGRLSEQNRMRFLKKSVPLVTCRKLANFPQKLPTTLAWTAMTAPPTTPRKPQPRRAQHATRNTAVAKIFPLPAVRLAPDVTVI